ncbi:formylglycine-generating enzyme family protein [Deltaproteobacteria bacterium TL4]
MPLKTVNLKLGLILSILILGGCINVKDSELEKSSPGNDTSSDVVSHKDASLEASSDASADDVNKKPSDKSLRILIAISNSMVKLSGGTFMRGYIQGAGYSNESPIHQVTLSQDFYISDHEVTANEYKACTEAGGCTYNGITTGSNVTYNIPGKENHPINYVSWNDAQDYVSWLNQNYPRSFRLCTEAEWEYATIAGTTTKWSCGNHESCLNDVAWYHDNNTHNGTKKVKTKKPNPWKLYDMYGNVWEWVQDWYENYASGAVTDPTGPASASRRVSRGGAFSNSSSDVRSTGRRGNSPDLRSSSIGIRICSSR